MVIAVFLGLVARSVESLSQNTGQSWRCLSRASEVKALASLAEDLGSHPNINMAA